MEIFLDRVWERLYVVIQFMAEVLNSVLSPLQSMAGPVGVIILLALVTVFITKVLKVKCRTKRLASLEEDFNYWLSIREEAMQCEDIDKGKRMARNIDQAKLNRSYYDYFFEGLLLSLATTYLPILVVLSYVNIYYRAERLMEIIGRDYIVQFGSSNGEPVLIGAVFFYLCSLFFFYLGYPILQKTAVRIRRNRICRSVENSGLAALD